jgi:hypothetical protein
MTSAWMHCCRKGLALLLLAAACGIASAHKASDAYLQLAGGPQGASLRVDVALRDLDLALDLDTDGDGRLTWREVRTAWPAIERYLRERIVVPGCAWDAATRALETRIDGVYAALSLRGDCVVGADTPIRYTVMRELDPTHRGIARIQHDGDSVLRVLDPTRPAEIAASPAAAPLQFLREGIHHIVTGYDHVLFLMCLLLPSVMRRTPQGWQPVPRWRDALLPVAGIVSAFTLAHSVTLGLAAMQWVSLPPAIVEPAIAITIVLAALDNLRPLFGGRRALVSFVFGLVHGFGFAGVLAELQLPASDFAWALLQFNLGLELGQLAIVALATAGLFALRRRARYPAWVIRGGSCAAIAVGLLWFVERSAEVSLLPL